MAARKWILLSLLIVLVAGAAAAAFGSKPKNEQKLQLQERLRLLELDYQILQKDDPPKSDTAIFRGSLADAMKSLEAGQLDQAEKSLAQAEGWMAQARPRYSREHESRVVAGSAPETSDQLLASALNFMQKGAAARDAGDQEAAKRYFQASIEQGELAVSSAGRSATTVEELSSLVEKMNTIYTAAGQPERMAQVRDRVTLSLQAALDASGRQIQQRLNNNAPGFDPQTLTDDRLAVEKAVSELNGLQEQYRRQAANADGFAPGQIESKDYSLSINLWSRKWRAVHDKQTPPPNNQPNKPDDSACIAAINAHNQVKKDAAASQGNGIVIEETEIYVEGEQVVVRGKVQNLRTQPILNPRITITGGVMSRVADLGYERMNPPTSTSFVLPLECFTVEAYNRSMRKIPSHEIVLIFKEPNGTERKIIQSMGVRAGK